MNDPSDGAFLVLTHDLQCRDLAGVITRLAQNSLIRVFKLDCLPDWSIFQNAQGQYAPVRDENVAQISVPARDSGYPAFATAEVADSTRYDTLEVEPTELSLVNDVVVCGSYGEALFLGEGSVVWIFAHSPNTFAWFRTADGQIFVVDPRRPVKMVSTLTLASHRENTGRTGRFEAEGDIEEAPKDVLQDIAPPAVQSNVTTSDQNNNIVDESPVAKKTDEIPEESAFLGAGDAAEWEWDLSTHSELSGLPLYGGTHIAGTVQATPASFTGDDNDFCEHCFSFTFDHAAHCPWYRVFR